MHVWMWLSVCMWTLFIWLKVSMQGKQVLVGSMCRCFSTSLPSAFNLSHLSPSNSLHFVVIFPRYCWNFSYTIRVFSVYDSQCICSPLIPKRKATIFDCLLFISSRSFQHSMEMIFVVHCICDCYSCCCCRSRLSIYKYIEHINRLQRMSYVIFFCHLKDFLLSSFNQPQVLCIRKKKSNLSTIFLLSVSLSFNGKQTLFLFLSALYEQ